jgi:hypothetical protein
LDLSGGHFSLAGCGPKVARLNCGNNIVVFFKLPFSK